MDGFRACGGLVRVCFGDGKHGWPTEESRGRRGMTLRIISVNVGLPQEVEWRGRTVLTSIWKIPIDGRVRVGSLNLEGDKQSDLSVHGGAEKAVYVYPSEHYMFWRNE